MKRNPLIAASGGFCYKGAGDTLPESAPRQTAFIPLSASAAAAVVAAVIVAAAATAGEQENEQDHQKDKAPAVVTIEARITHKRTSP